MNLPAFSSGMRTASIVSPSGVEKTNFAKGSRDDAALCLTVNCGRWTRPRSAASVAAVTPAENS